MSNLLSESTPGEMHLNNMNQWVATSQSYKCRPCSCGFYRKNIIIAEIQDIASNCMRHCVTVVASNIMTSHCTHPWRATVYSFLWTCYSEQSGLPQSSMDRNTVKTITLWLRQAFGVRKNSNADSGDWRALLLKGKMSPGWASPTVPLTGTQLPQGSAILQGAFCQGIGRWAALRCPHCLDRKRPLCACAWKGVSRRHKAAWGAGWLQPTAAARTAPGPGAAALPAGSCGPKSTQLHRAGCFLAKCLHPGLVWAPTPEGKTMQAGLPGECLWAVGSSVSPFVCFSPQMRGSS